MNIFAVHGNIESFKTELIALGIFEEELNNLNELAKNIDEKLNNEISHLIKNKHFKAESKETHLISSLSNLPAKKILIIGLGKKKEFELEDLRNISAVAAKNAKELGIKQFAHSLHEIELSTNENYNLSEKVKAVVEGTLLSLYDFNEFKTQEREKIKEIDSLTVVAKDNLPEIEKAVKFSTIICNGTLYARNLVNKPSNIVTPTYLAKEAESIAKENKLKVKVLGKKEIAGMNMNGLLSVGKGSAHEPKFIVLEYNANAKKKIAVVGKGITFDAGGLNLKSSSNIDDMKLDMAGAAAVLGIMKVVPKLKLNLNVYGIIPACENMPSGTAQKPGDIIKMFNKKTVEVADTDAEGRLILGDALAYAEKLNVNAIIDLATLTGSCISALGHEAAGLFGTNKELIEKIKSSGERTHERVWELPLWEDYKDLMKSDVADVRNVSKTSGAGAITGAIFLNNFVEKVPWAHIDIAGTAWIEEDKDYIPKNATGYGVRLIIDVMRDF